MTNDQIAERLEAAQNTRDLAAFGELLAPDAHWGDDFHPNKCRSRGDVVRTFSRVMGEGTDGSVLAATAGPGGVVCELEVRWGDPDDRSRGVRFYHSLHRARRPDRRDPEARRRVVGSARSAAESSPSLELVTRALRAMAACGEPGSPAGL